MLERYQLLPSVLQVELRASLRHEQLRFVPLPVVTVCVTVSSCGDCDVRSSTRYSDGRYLLQ